MALEHPSPIDAIGKDRAGNPVGVIIDAGVTTNDEQRLALLEQKLQACVEFLASDRFLALCPGTNPCELQIVVLSKHRPSHAMKQIRTVALGGGQPESVSVSFRRLDKPVIEWD